MSRKRAGAKRLKNPAYPGDNLVKLNIQLWRSQIEWLDQFISNESGFFRDFIAYCMATQAIPDENVANRIKTLEDEMEFHHNKKREHEWQLYQKRIEVYSILKNVDLRKSQDAQRRQVESEHEDILMTVFRAIPALYNLFKTGNLDAVVQHLQTICKKIPKEKIIEFFKIHNEQPSDDVILDYFRELIR